MITGFEDEGMNSGIGSLKELKGERKKILSEPQMECQHPADTSISP
jgi:hypothetical protein